jgi:Rad3-related DNA helicase
MLLLNIKAFSSENIYTADIEFIITQVSEYSEINNKLLNYKKDLNKKNLQIEKKILNIKNRKIKEINIFKKDIDTHSIWGKEVEALYKQILYNEQLNKNSLLEKERTLKFPLIKKILSFIQREYDQSKISFIIDPDSLFFYKKKATKIIDLTDEIIIKYNSKI